MDHNLTTALVTILTGIIGVATIAVIVSRNANTANVIQAGSAGFAQDLSVAISPVGSGGGLISPSITGNSFTATGIQ